MQTEQHTQQPNNPSREEIISGAGNDDQLEKLRPAEEHNEAKQNGTTSPSTGDEHLEATKITDKQPAEKTDTYAEQEAIAGKSGDAKNLGGATNLSLDQLKNEGDNNQ